MVTMRYTLVLNGVRYNISSNQIEILQHLANKDRVHWGEIYDIFARNGIKVSRSRNVKALKNRGFVREVSNNYYKITPLGMQILDTYKSIYEGL